MSCLKLISVEACGRSLLVCRTTVFTQTAGIRYFYPKVEVESNKSEWPEYRKLKVVEKQPAIVNKNRGMPQRKMLMRGPEPVHTELLYKGYGVKALIGGRLKARHFETIRNIIIPKIDQERMFIFWRVDPPWQPITKKGIGKQMGGGKGSAHHFVTPVKADRIIVELGGDLSYIEALKILAPVTEVLPFPSRFISQKQLDYEKAREEWSRKNNLNPFTMEYVIKNNMGGCHQWLSKYDFKWYGRYK